MTIVESTVYIKKKNHPDLNQLEENIFQNEPTPLGSLEVTKIVIKLNKCNNNLNR